MLQQTSCIASLVVACVVSLGCQHAYLLQTLRRRIDVLSKQKSDIKSSLAAAKSSCEHKDDDNSCIKSQIKVAMHPLPFAANVL